MPRKKKADGEENFESQASLTEAFGGIGLSGGLDGSSNPSEKETGQEVRITAIVMFHKGEVVVPQNCIFVSSGFNEEDDEKMEMKVKDITSVLDEEGGQYKVIRIFTTMQFASPITKIVGVSKKFLNLRFKLSEEKAKYARKKRKSMRKIVVVKPPSSQTTLSRHPTK